MAYQKSKTPKPVYCNVEEENLTSEKLEQKNDCQLCLKDYVNDLINYQIADEYFSVNQQDK